jgi:hypothetical protein
VVVVTLLSLFCAYTSVPKKAVMIIVGEHRPFLLFV